MLDTFSLTLDNIRQAKIKFDRLAWFAGAVTNHGNGRYD
jgi:hypothetical protein